MRKAPKSPKVSVNVTTENMEASRTRDSAHCMIATAVREAVPNATAVSVDLQTVRFSLAEKGFRYTYLTPRHAQLALIKFDQGTMPEPFSFVLRQAHVTTMYKKKLVTTPRKRMSAKQKEALQKATETNPNALVTLHSHVENAPIHPELAAQQIVPLKTGELLRVGGKLSPTTPFAKRRAFGLRALER